MPEFQLLPCVVKAHEPVRVQTLRAEAAVKGFDIRIIRWLPRSGEVHRYIMRIGPEIQITRDEFTAIAYPELSVRGVVIALFIGSER
jgi:hypothetical protein